MLYQIAQLGEGWRNTLPTLPYRSHAQTKGPGSVRVFQWHFTNQTQLLEKALSTTAWEGLGFIPFLEHADHLGRAKQVLDVYPMDQTTELTASWNGRSVRPLARTAT